MVTVISGGSNSSREDIFVERIKKAAEGGKDVLVIIPDQFSFEYDKKLYKAMGAKLFNGIETVGFNRLSEKLCVKYGGALGDNADENAKIILMYKAVKRFKKDGVMRFYKKYLDKGDFLTELIDLVGQLRESGISPEDLQIAAERLEGSVSLKLFDISRIYAYYLEELSSAGMADSLTASSLAVRLAEENGFFEGKNVFVSAFNSFTYDERRMLDICISQCENFTVSLLIDDECTGKFHNHPFAVTVKTKMEIVDIAADHNKKTERITADKYSFRSDDLLRLSKNLFNLSRKPYITDKNDVQIYGADDLYEETEYICAEICRLVRDEGYKFNDIAVTVRSFDQCASVFEGIFERYGIPYYIDRHDGVSASAIVHYLNSLFKTVLTKSYKTENIMKLIKSPLFGILNYDISFLEDYCLKWNVDGDMWCEPFTAGSEGTVKKVNELREKIILPLERFKNASDDAEAKEICEALYVLLEDIQLSQQTYSVVKRASGSDNDTEIELARSLKQLWNCALSAVKSIYECLGDEKITLKQFYELYRLMLSQMTVANPPQKLDCVRITEAGRSRTDEVKVMFAAEVNDGIFPAQITGGGLITEREKEILSRAENIVIEKNAMRDFQNEKLITYTALTSASDKLYLTYSRSDLLGNEKRPSMLIKEVTDILGVKCQTVSSLPLEFFCTSYRAAYSKYIEHSRDNDVHSASVCESLKYSSHYANRIAALKSENLKQNYSLSEKTAEDVFFKNSTAYISPTAIESYYRCPFKYFCERGLKLSKPSKVEIDYLNKGNIIHFLLEKLLKNIDAENKNMDDDSIREFVHCYVTEYYNEQLGGDFGKTSEFMFLLSKLEETAFYIVKFVLNELSDCKFKPALIEYEINSTNDSDLLTIELDGKNKLKLVGKIDRADIFEDENGERYVRIIDYKTGEKNIKLSSLYNGLNLQMFVYLSQLLQSKDLSEPDKKLRQAGVIYFNFKDGVSVSPDSELPDDELYKMACELHAESPKATGKIADVQSVLEAMKTPYAPYKSEEIGRANEVIITDNMFTALRKFSILKTEEFGKLLLSGQIGAKPVDKTCSYCAFGGICGSSDLTDPVNTEKVEYEKLLREKLDEIMEGDENI